MSTCFVQDYILALLATDNTASKTLNRQHFSDAAFLNNLNIRDQPFLSRQAAAMFSLLYGMNLHLLRTKR